MSLEPNSYARRSDHSFWQMRRQHVGNPVYQRNCRGQFLHARELGGQRRSGALTLEGYGEQHCVYACGRCVYGLRPKRYWQITK